MRVGLWIATIVVGLLFLMAALPWLTMKEFRESSRGREFRLLILALGFTLAMMIVSLAKASAPAAAP